MLFRSVGGWRRWIGMDGEGIAGWGGRLLNRLMVDERPSSLTGGENLVSSLRVVWFLVTGRLCSCSNHLQKYGFLVLTIYKDVVFWLLAERLCSLAVSRDFVSCSNHLQRRRFLVTAKRVRILRRCDWFSSFLS